MVLNAMTMKETPLLLLLCISLADAEPAGSTEEGKGPCTGPTCVDDDPFAVDAAEDDPFAAADEAAPETAP